MLYKVLVVYLINLVIGNNTKIMTPRIPHVIGKELCNILYISISHEYTSILPY